MVAAHLKSSENTTDFHFAHNRKDGTQPTITDKNVYEKFFTRFSNELERDLGMISVDDSPRFPFITKNLAYRLRDKEKLSCNVFALRPSTELMIFDVKKMLYAYRIACIISEELDCGKGIEEDDVKDFATTGFGYFE